jgi:hypothetical protein
MLYGKSFGRTGRRSGNDLRLIIELVNNIAYYFYVEGSYVIYTGHIIIVIVRR